MQIVELSGLSCPTVRAAIDRYGEGGLAAIKPAMRGKRAGLGRTLTEEQEQAIRKIICDERPEQLKMEFALWNGAAVMQLIERDYEQRPEAVQAWLNEQYPEIEKRAKAEGGETHWGDETALVNTDVRGRQLRAGWQDAGHLHGRRYAAKAVDDCHGDQPGQDTLDDH